MTYMDKTILVITALALLFLNGCMAVPPLMSAAGGYYTHQRMGDETEKIDVLSQKIKDLEGRIK